MKFLKRLAFVLPVFFLVCFSVLAADFPKPVGYVNDFGSLFSSGFRQTLEQDLENFEKETAVEIAVVTINSLEGNAIEDYAVRLFEQWKIGKKGKDNGLLILIAKEDRKIKIEVGYGLEPIITDGRAGRIIREQMSPAFKEEDYEGGVKAAVEKIKNYISSGEPPSEEETVQAKSGAFIFLIIAAFFLIYFSSFWGRSKRIWPGGVIGIILGLIIYPLIGALLLGIWGLFLDWLLSRNYKRLKKLGKSTGLWSSRGGFSSGGRSSGGFGGFGGGSSGGGGASGGW